MATSALSLPVDVPWKRLAISQDMYATSADKLNPRIYGFLDEWRTSLSVFFYEPDPDPTDTSGEVTTFLKLVASITGYHVYGDIILPKGTIHFDEFYPTFCAVAQIAVFPDTGEWPLEQFPYFTDFQPKTRELVETQTATGEQVTQTAEPLNVTKSTTNTYSQVSENYVKQVTGVTETTITDASRQKRETTAYSTNLSQMYHLLESYHSGTNRAVFLTTARPHLVDSVYTFVNGPRRLEGIQEFFLVVRRPKEMTGICVNAELETASLDLSDTSGSPATLYLTSRAVSGCTGAGHTHILPQGPWVTWEEEIPQSVNDLLKAAQESGKPAVAAANAASRAIRDMVVKSYAKGVRYPLGKVDFLKTNFGMRKILSRVPPETLHERPEVLEAIARIHPTLSLPAPRLSEQDFTLRAELLQMLGNGGSNGTTTE